MIRVIQQGLTIPLDANPSQKIYLENEPIVDDNILVGLQIPQSFVDVGYYDNPLDFAIPTFDNQQVNSFTQTQPVFVSGAQTNTLFLTLCDKNGNELFKNLSLSTFYVQQNRGLIRDFFYNKIDTKKSYVQCGGKPYILPPSNNKPFVLLFNFIVKIIK